MTCFPDSQSPEEILSEVLDLLNETRVRSFVGESIDVALSHRADCSLEGHANLNGDLLDHLGRVMKRIQGVGTSEHYEQDRTVAQGAAVSILRQCYAGAVENGYVGALQDVAEYGEPAVTLVDNTLIEGVRAELRQRYVNWVMTTRITVLDWQKKRDLVSYILREWKDMLPEDLLKRTPGELVPACEELILAGVGALETLNQVLDR